MSPTNSDLNQTPHQPSRPQKVSLHLQDAFHEEVKRLVQIDVLEPVSEPTKWVNSFVVVEKQVNIDSSNAHSPGQSIKKKKMQLYADTKDLNEVPERKPYYSRSIDELITKSSGTDFTNVDTSKDCLQVILHQESRKQEVRHPQSKDYSKTFKISRFQWKQLPVGTAVAVEIFQRTLKLKVPLQELIQTDIHKQAFMCIHKQAFTCTKSEFSTKFTLQCFSKDKETFLQTDASKKGFSPRMHTRIHLRAQNLNPNMHYPESLHKT